MPMARTGHLALQVLTEPMARMENAALRVSKARQVLQARTEPLVRRETKESADPLVHRVLLAPVLAVALLRCGG